MADFSTYDSGRVAEYLAAGSGGVAAKGNNVSSSCSTLASSDSSEGSASANRGSISAAISSNGLNCLRSRSMAWIRVCLLFQCSVVVLGKVGRRGVCDAGMPYQPVSVQITQLTARQLEAIEQPPHALGYILNVDLPSPSTDSDSVIRSDTSDTWDCDSIICLGEYPTGPTDSDSESVICLDTSDTWDKSDNVSDIESVILVDEPVVSRFIHGIDTPFSPQDLEALSEWSYTPRRDLNPRSFSPTLSSSPSSPRSSNLSDRINSPLDSPISIADSAYHSIQSVSRRLFGDDSSYNEESD
ncbi:hypothetical protein QAD02_011580 [Eretmocerus hayati]|uniref:Uncharacterized protein n=1 Tax=Eretmocerus hayati TaxID=131215 RepID=A0ACC2NXJ0_9HYME|nr:hypothetical protein QAD02_011580 [Eretmocerus hayati]